VFVVGETITPLNPIVSGTVSNYSVAPALPNGLTLTTSDGVISGKPTEVAAATTYTVTASNSSGSTTTTISIQVNAIPPAISYPSTTLTFATQGSTTVTPSSSGGAVVTWSVVPALPAGLTLNTTTGSITNASTAVIPAANYVVTARNSGGQSQVTLTIQVANVLLELGHAVNVIQIQRTTSNALSEDVDGHWVLWNVPADTMVTSGNSSCLTPTCKSQNVPVALAGQTAVIETAAGLELRAVSDGHVVATIPGPISWWKLASDGSYISTGNASALQAWSPSGQSLYSKSGDYSAAVAFAASGAIQMALGAAGTNVIETISLASGTSSVSPSFLGQFYNWFSDGSHFLSTATTIVYTYSNTGVSEGEVNLPTLQNLGGTGNWFWAYQGAGALNVYAVGGGAVPAATYPFGTDSLLIPSGPTFAILPYGAAQINIVDLSGAAPTSAVTALPIAYDLSYAATSASQWLVGNAWGVVLDGASLATTPKYLALGAAWSIASGGGLAAIATASGQIFVMNPATSLTQTTLNFVSSQIEMSSDGTVLAAMGDTQDSQYAIEPVSVQVFSLPSGTVINSWSNGEILGFSLAPSGSVIALVVTPSSGVEIQQVTATSGGPVLWSSTTDLVPVQFSPDGTLIAASNGGQNPNTSTNIYQNYTLVASVPGLAVGWIDNGHLLVNSYKLSNESVTGGLYTGCTVYSPTGTILSTPALPELTSIQTVTPSNIYAPNQNAIYSLTTGAPTWTGGVQAKNVGAIAGNYAVFMSGAQVLAAPY
jgi:hypothetical protein